MRELICLGLARSVGGAEEPVGGPYDLIGLSPRMVLAVFPLELRGWTLIVAVRNGASLSGEVTARTPAGRKLFGIGVDMQFEVYGDLGHATDGWTIVPLRITGAPGTTFTVTEPGEYLVTFATNAGVETVGWLDFIYQPPPPLTADVVAAIRSDPFGVKSVAMRFVNQRGETLLTAYAALEKNETDFMSAPNRVWYEDLPDELVPDDGTERIPLRYLRAGMHHYLGSANRRAPVGQVHGSSLYSIDVIQGVLREFLALLDCNPREQDIQDFIERNPLLLAPFGALRLFVKPPILNRYKADFGLITPRDELVLIEIEPADTSLFTNDGAPRSWIVHAQQQVRDWLAEVDRDRSAVLHCIENCPTTVSRVRCCIIAGRTVPQEAEYLRRFVATGLDRTEFYTYDQLVREVQAIAMHAGMVRLWE